MLRYRLAATDDSLERRNPLLLPFPAFDWIVAYKFGTLCRFCQPESKLLRVMIASHPLFRRFENELTVGEQKLEWTMRDRDFCFRPLGADVRIVWCELARRDMPSAIEQPERLKKVKARLLENLAQKQVERLWPLDEERELVLKPNYALMRHREADFWLRVEWEAALSADDLFFQPELSLIEKRLESIEELRAATQTAGQQGQLERFVCSQTNIRELESALGAYFALSGNYLHYFAKGHLSFASLIHAPYDAPAGQHLQVRKVCEILDRHFIIQWNPLVKRFCDREGRPQRRPHISIRKTCVQSQHERLEALLEWGNFLRDKLPPREVEMLLNI